ncbi:MAG: hypothetical protein ACKVII_01815 [Planctomycetales bacterium]|jgi:hypothetical protein
MYRNFLTMAALAAAAGWSAQASAQYPTALPAPVAAPYTVPTQRIVTTPPNGQAVGPMVAPGTRTFTVQYVPAAPNSVTPGTAGAPTIVTQPRAIPPTAGNITAISPMPTYASTAMHVPVSQPYAVTNIASAPAQAIPQNTQVYTPSYYYYYYQQQPYQAPAAPMMPVASVPMVPVVPMQPVSINPFSGAYTGASGPMYNARGEMGHVRYPYYSYRRPWYYSGQPSFNVTIPGPVW